MKSRFVLLLSICFCLVFTFESNAQYVGEEGIYEDLNEYPTSDSIKNNRKNRTAKSDSKSRKKKGKRNSDKQKANDMYEDLGYKASIKMYKRLSKEEKEDVQTLSKIANGFRLNHETEEASFWYSRFIHNSSNPDDYLHYAQVLQSSGDCKRAVKWYKKYLDNVDEKGKTKRTFIKDCEELNNFANHREIELFNVEQLNSDDLDFSPIPYQDGVVFTSTRGQGGLSKNYDRWTDQDFSDLFFATLNTEGKFEDPIPLMGDINAKYHDGVATFGHGGTLMIFTRNNYEGKSKKGLIDLKIYWATKDEEGFWSEAEELSFNSNEFTSCHPTLSADSRRLYFASNRPGGYGGLDLYRSDFLGGEWSEPVNLGPKVNTAGNELFPFVGEDETVYFASNGHKGIGGLDIFMTESTETEDDWHYEEVQHMGRPFNSKKDDFGFYINAEKNKGYLTSSRSGGKGEDDIYSWVGPLHPDLMAFDRDICVYEEGTDIRIEDAEVVITRIGEEDKTIKTGSDLLLTLKPLDEKEKEYVLGVVDNRAEETEKDGRPKVVNTATDSAGIFNQNIKVGDTYTYTVSKTGYITHTETLTAEELKKKLDHCIPLAKKLCFAFEGQVVLKDKGSLMPQANVEVWNKCTNEKIIYDLNDLAAFKACLDCGCDYRLRAYQSGYDDDYEFTSTIGKDCKSGEKMELKLEIGERKIVISEDAEPIVETYMETPPIMHTIPVTTYEEVVTYQPVTTYQAVTSYRPVTKNIPASEWTPDMLSGHFLGDPNVGFEEGQLLTLKDIYYDFDKYNIREDASLDLQRLLQLMKTYPSMEVRLESHTDSRGTKKYNKRLASNRAKEARKFLITKGISAKRIKATGFGEGRLRNHCADNVDCNEQEHQLNRRTEVRITRFEENGVQIYEPER